jgi:hypothetical protein
VTSFFIIFYDFFRKREHASASALLPLAGVLYMFLNDLEELRIEEDTTRSDVFPNMSVTVACILYVSRSDILSFLVSKFNLFYYYY